MAEPGAPGQRATQQRPGFDPLRRVRQAERIGEVPGPTRAPAAAPSPQQRPGVPGPSRAEIEASRRQLKAEGKRRKKRAEKPLTVEDVREMSPSQLKERDPAEVISVVREAMEQDAQEGIQRVPGFYGFDYEEAARGAR